MVCDPSGKESLSLCVFFNTLKTMKKSTIMIKHDVGGSILELDTISYRLT